MAIIDPIAIATAGYQAAAQETRQVLSLGSLSVDVQSVPTIDIVEPVLTIEVQSIIDCA